MAGLPQRVVVFLRGEAGAAALGRIASRARDPTCHRLGTSLPQPNYPEPIPVPTCPCPPSTTKSLALRTPRRPSQLSISEAQKLPSMTSTNTCSWSVQTSSFSQKQSVRISLGKDWRLLLPGYKISTEACLVSQEGHRADGLMSAVRKGAYAISTQALPDHRNLYVLALHLAATNNRTAY